jgi:hypothetical protein
VTNGGSSQAALEFQKQQQSLADLSRLQGKVLSRHSTQYSEYKEHMRVIHHRGKATRARLDGLVASRTQMFSRLQQSVKERNIRAKRAAYHEVRKHTCIAASFENLLISSRWTQVQRLSERLGEGYELGMAQDSDMRKLLDKLFSP